MKVIKYYRKSSWGETREFIHPDNMGDGAIIKQLTGKKTIDGVVRELIRDLTGSQVQFEETTAPKAN